MRVLQLMSCRGWSSDAYWAARVSAELERAGHEVTLVCKRGTDARVIERARETGVRRTETLGFASGVKPLSDLADVQRLRQWLDRSDVVHVHRGKEHWLAALANRWSARQRPLVRTRHIVQPIRPHALNRWLYRRATNLVVTVTEAIRRQYIAADLVPADRVVARPGGVDADCFRPGIDGSALRRSLGVPPEIPLLGIVSGFRAMKGHEVAIEAAARLASAGRRFHMVFVGTGALETRIRGAIAAAGLERSISLVGFARELPSAMAALDVALYPALESDGMSRVLFEYLAMARPVVASRVGVVPEALEHERTALLVPAGEPGALAAAIGRLLDDGGLARTIATAARALVDERLSGAALAEGLVTHYRRLATDIGRTA
jgi:glycosyltransferase involved in cell wall biosynthesis